MALAGRALDPLLRPPSVDGGPAEDTSEALVRDSFRATGGARRANYAPPDIVSCPDKNTWGVSFDDGPSGYSKYRSCASESCVKATCSSISAQLPRAEGCSRHLLRCRFPCCREACRPRRGVHERSRNQRPHLVAQGTLPSLYGFLESSNHVLFSPLPR